MCLEDWLFSECGAGACVNSSCICEPGVTQSNEFLYVSLPEDGSYIYCDYYQPLALTLFSFILVMTIVTFFIQLCILENHKQLRRLTPGLIGFLCAFIAFPIRIARIDEPSLFGFDFVFTLFFANATGLLLVQYMVFLSKSRCSLYKLTC